MNIWPTSFGFVVDWDESETRSKTAGTALVDFEKDDENAIAWCYHCDVCYCQHVEAAKGFEERSCE